MSEVMRYWVLCPWYFYDAVEFCRSRRHSLFPYMDYVLLTVVHCSAGVEESGHNWSSVAALRRLLALESSGSFSGLEPQTLMALMHCIIWTALKPTPTHPLFTGGRKPVPHLECRMLHVVSSEDQSWRALSDYYYLSCTPRIVSIWRSSKGPFSFLQQRPCSCCLASSSRAAHLGLCKYA